MSCGLPLEFFEDGSIRVQPLDPDAAEQGVISCLGEGEDAARWLEWVRDGDRSVKIHKPVVNRGSFIYWVEVVPAEEPDLPTRHYLITWKTWFELRRLGMI